jgi:hypothetical protein
MIKQDYEMTEQEVTMDILKNPEKYEYKNKVSEMMSLLSAACGLVNQNPEVFDYHTYRKPLEELIHLCMDNDYRLNQ